MGSPNSVQFEGTGSFYALGQANRPGMGWPRMNLTRYQRVDDYSKGELSLETVVTRGDLYGGGAIPLTGELRRGAGLSGDRAWAILYPIEAPSPASATQLQHDLWTMPHGIVKAAMTDGAKMDGSSFEITRAGKFKAKATVNGQNLVSKVESIIDNPVFGDMQVVTTYFDYKDYGGVKFPSRIVQTAGGHPILDVIVRDVKPNTGSVTAPAQIAAVPNEVKVDKAADGIFFVHGGSHNSVAIEMRDHIVLFEAPLGDGRTNLAIQATKDAIPGKPIRTVLVTHHHFDHSGGLRAAAAEDATIVAPEVTKPFYEQAYRAPRTLNPDKLARAGKQAKIEGFSGDKHVVSDGTRSIELHILKDNPHAEGFVIGYLPREKILIVADAFSPRAPVTQTPAYLSPITLNLMENIQRLKLDVDTILPIHGRIVKVGELMIEAGVRN
jgi:glyoxylase-like metal-dependent hydrolase (beta-lactamase superfamily II)